MAEDTRRSKKSGKKDPINRTAKNKSYSYDPLLENYLKEALRLEETKQEKKDNGNRLSATDLRERKRNQEHKVDVLNKIIFPSMANLIYLLEYLNNHSEVESILKKDIDELFGLKGPYWGKTSTSDGLKYRALYRMITSLLRYRDMNTRLRILNMIGSGIIQQLVIIGKEKDERMSGIMEQDLARLQAWIHYCTSGTQMSYRPAHRLLTF